MLTNDRMAHVAGGRRSGVDIDPMVHGDIKGVRSFTTVVTVVRFILRIKANILTDQTHDPSNQLSSGSHTQCGTARWMSPELIDLKRFGCETSCATNIQNAM